jgi:hypothetical protein
MEITDSRWTNGIEGVGHKPPHRPHVEISRKSLTDYLIQIRLLVIPLGDINEQLPAAKIGRSGVLGRKALVGIVKIECSIQLFEAEIVTNNRGKKPFVDSALNEITLQI